jgi:beta-aspartyl-peptidase (threonine type)
MRWLLCMSIVAAAAGSAAAQDTFPNVVLGIHGGTGMEKAKLTPELEKLLRADLKTALETGKAALDKGGTSLDAVEAAIRVLEDSPHFNAGKGAVFTKEGRNELDASIMEGREKKAGAVAGVTIVKNPISAARAVMEKSKHVLLTGRGAEVFATKAGLEIVDPQYFWTPRRWEDWKNIQGRREEDLPPTVAKPPAKPAHEPPHQWGTVGAVARDKQGNLAAGTSTGGMTGKQWGRVGDSPIIGAGTYAENETCAVSCTGHGEYFIRYAVSHSVTVLMKYKQLGVKAAAESVVNDTLKKAGGEGGLVALDGKGNFAFAYNSEGLYRGWITADGKVQVMLYED